MLGGPQGQDLPYLCNFAVITAERGPVLAFEASFANGRPPVRFGLFEPGETVDRIDFDVDGPGGERIITVEGIWANGDDFAGFRVSAAFCGFRSQPNTTFLLQSLCSLISMARD